MAIDETTLAQLTADQRALIPTIEDRWLAHALSTEPADRAAAEEGIRLAYEAIGLEPPSTFVWRGSPLGGGIAAKALQATQELVSDWIWNDFTADTYGQVVSALGQHAYQLRIARCISGTIASRIGRRMWDHIEAQAQQLAGILEWSWSDYPINGQLAAGKLADYEFLTSFLDETPLKSFEAIGLVTRSADCWWPFESVAIVTDRPEWIGHDERGLPHAADGPAIRYRDGWGIWSWHGVRVPRQVIEAPETLVPLDIHYEENAEVRRVMIERYGPERFVKGLGAKLIDEDERGRLWRATLPEDEPLAMVEVVNSTPEPDGSFKQYWLRVPPDCGTAREAVAWSFDQPTSDYLPAIET